MIFTFFMGRVAEEGIWGEGGGGGCLMPNNMISLSPLSTQDLVLFNLEDFSDTMGDVIEGCNLNIGPSGAEAPPP